jgi:hypothetical protein
MMLKSPLNPETILSNRNGTKNASTSTKMAKTSQSPMMTRLRLLGVACHLLRRALLDTVSAAASRLPRALLSLAKYLSRKR